MKRTVHSFVHVKFMSYPYCRYCGLIGLNNKRTWKARKKPCEGTH